MLYRQDEMMIYRVMTCISSWRLYMVKTGETGGPGEIRYRPEDIEIRPDDLKGRPEEQKGRPDDLRNAI